jgi:hypothetical protein
VKKVVFEVKDKNDRSPISEPFPAFNAREAD